MADFKSVFDNAVLSDVSNLGGDTILSRGGDPNITVDSPNGLTPIWGAAQPVTDFGQTETANSISGLPSLPNRWEPSAAAEQPPDLTDRSPGTIDRR